MNDEELFGMFKSHRTKTALRPNRDRVKIIPDCAFDFSNHSTAYQQQSYFIKEVEALKLETETGDKRLPCGFSCQLTLYNRQTTFMEAEKRKGTSGTANLGGFVEQITECSVPPIRLEDEHEVVEAHSCSSQKKVYGEPPVFLDNVFSTKYLDLLFNSQVLTANNARTNSESCDNNGRNRVSTFYRIRSPPWQPFLHRVRGRFIHDTGRLAVLKKIAEERELNVDGYDFFKEEILKRNCRMEIFDKIHAKHMQLLQISSDAEALITELMHHEIQRFACGLPVYNIREEIKNTLCNQTRVLLVVAGTGSGKSTQIPQYLVFDGIIASSMKVLCSQPRKVAVCELAMRVAKETSLRNHCLVNVPVYEDGTKPNLSAKINFVTEKQLLDCIKQDRKLSQFGCVMMDEVHERTVNTDICLGMMKIVLRLRPDMKLVISSATVDPEPLLKYFAEFQARKLEIPWRQYDTKIFYEPPVPGCKGIRSLTPDYIDRTVEKVLNICEKEAKKQPFDGTSVDDNLETHAGHIMAFLSNPNETLIAEERLSNRLTEIKHSVNVKIVTLYGNMPIEDRNEVFAPLKPGYHHKVIFATNVGETSITVPGVRYVIDCGLAKVKKFDPIKRKNFVELGLISKSAAKQRAGRAGRTSPGICYRLYSEEQYEEMESANVPDILLTNLTRVVLYMIAAGVSLAEFDFIEKPDSSVLLHSQALLRSLKAIEPRESTLVLTQLGRQIQQLPVEPRLAKMVLDSVQYDLVAEVAVVCACIHVGSLFHRGNKRNKFVLADQKILSFCEESGDPMTFLAVFMQYIGTPKGRFRHWCFENYVNLKRMRSVFCTANKICKIMSHFTGVIADINSIDISKARAVIPNLYCRSFGSNLAMYSGLQERGYYDFNEKKHVFIHPSSALKYGDITPEYIVYECSIHTSNDFVLNVCAADPSWLHEIDHNVVEEERQNRLVPYNVRCGAAVKRWILAQKSIIQQKVGMECIEKKRFGDPYHRLQIYVSLKNLTKLETYVERIIKEKMDLLCKITREVPIMHADYVLHMSGSGAPLEILMPEEFCSMYVGRSGINWKNNVAYKIKLEEYFGKFGKITEFVTFGEEYQRQVGHSCLIRMENKEVAKRAFIYNNENHCDLNIKPRFGRKYLSRVNKYRPSAYRLLIRWWRRPSCGYGEIKLKSRNFDQRIYAFNVISKHLGHFQPSMLSEDLLARDPNMSLDDLYKIKLQSVPLDIDNERLLYDLVPVLNAYDIEFDEAYVVRKKKYPVEEEKDLEEHSRRISEHIMKVAKDAVGSNGFPFEVKVRVPKHRGEIEFMAFVLFSDMNIGIHVGNALKEAAENGTTLQMGPVNYMHEAHVQQMFHYHMKVPLILFNMIFNDLKNIYDIINHELVDFNYHNDTNRKVLYVSVSGENFNYVNEVKAAIDKVINGYIIKCRDGERIDDIELPCHRLLTKVGQDFLHKLSQRYAVLTNTLPYKMEVKIQGSVLSVEKAKIEIKRFLQEWLDADINQILILQPPNYQPGTLKALLAQNNYDLYLLEKQFDNGLHLDANITRRELQFIGKEAQLQELLRMLRSISDSIQSRDASKDTSSEIGTPDCVVCLCAADLENYCLEACGHYACKACLNIQLKASIETHNFPIVCVACEKPFTWLDLEVLVLGGLNRNKDEDPQNLQSLSDASLACFIERHGDLYKHCLTPDCRGLHNVTVDAGLSQCRLCGRIQCSKCGNEEHESMACEEYAVLRLNADESVRRWIREDETRRRICPNINCQAVIEKFGGCNHMQCSRCKQHFCWICMFIAAGSNEIYAHMDAEHGGSGADVHDLIAEMENDPFIRDFVGRQHLGILLDPRFNVDEEAEFWVMPDENVHDGEQVFMVDGDEIHNFFEFEQGLNGFITEEMDEPDAGYKAHNDFEESADADIV